MTKVQERKGGSFEVEDGTSRIAIGALFLVVGFLGLTWYYLSAFRGVTDAANYVTGDVFAALLLLSFLGVIIAYWGRVVYGNAVRDWDVNKVREELALTREHQEGLREAIHSPKMVVETPQATDGR
jgi:hypothetical protein